MLPASNRGVGTAVGTPDTCNTPTGTGVDVPTPYANTGDHSQSVGFSTTVYVTMMNALSTAATVPTTTGDESGTTHPTIKGKMSHSTGNPVVYVDSVPAVTVSSVTSHNNGNCPAGSVVSPGSANVFFTLRGSDAVPEVGAARAFRADEAAAMADRASGPTLTTALRGRTLVASPRVITDATTSELLAALAAHRDAASVELDLRGVPGGTLEGACRLAALFLSKGREIARVTDLDGDVDVHRSDGGPLTETEVVVLVDASTASAAEIVALALAANARARVTGASYGKATAQRITIVDGVRVLATVASIAGPGGVPLDGRYDFGR